MPQQSADHIDDPVLLGRRLREARLAGGLRQGDLAFAGCSIGYISRIESGMRVPSLQVVRRLAGSVGVSERWLATGEPDIPEGLWHVPASATLPSLFVSIMWTRPRLLCRDRGR